MLILRRLPFWLWACFLVAGCAPGESFEPPQPTYELRLYRTPSPTQEVTLEPPALPSPQSAGPTPTPLTYTIQEGDTLLGVALRYGLELEQLLAVNPGVNPRALSIGQQIYIPAPEGEEAGALLATPTPVPLELSAVRCYPTPAGDLWCGLEVHNGLEPPVEGTSVSLYLFGVEGELLAQKVVHSPLNRIQAGDFLPFFAFFEDLSREFVAAQARLQSAVVYEKESYPYADMELTVQRDERSTLGKRWLLAGRLAVPDDAQASDVRASVLLIAFDERDQVVGYSKWEAKELLEAGEAETFELTVFSAGPSIERVETRTEGLVLSQSS
jgi:LysM repeat protein